MVHVRAMLCNTGTESDILDPTMALEPKYDGTRVWLGKEDGRPFVENREGVNYTGRLGEVTEAIRGIASEDYIIDGEAVVLDENGRSKFALSQIRCSTENPMKQRELRIKYPALIMAFDIIKLDGKDVRSMPWADRVELLDGLLKHSLQKVIEPTPHAFDDDKMPVYRKLKQAGEEGVVLKRIDSEYTDAITSAWLKVKKFQLERVRVVGYSRGSGSRASSFGALILARERGGKLIYCGKVGSGFNAAEIKKMKPLLAKTSTRKLVEVPDEDYTPIDAPLEVTVKFMEATESGVFRQPTLEAIHYERTIEGKGSDVDSLLEGLV